MAPALPARTVHNHVCSSERWAGYRARGGDVIIATNPRVGTTWMQRIVSLLIFQTPEAGPIWGVSPHIDGLPGAPIDTIWARVDAQTHRRFFKSHLPFDALPLHDEVKYIHVSRDPRDACLSLFEYITAWTPELAAATDRGGLAEPAINRRLPRVPTTHQGFFDAWLRRGIEVGAPFMADMFFDIERSFWRERRRSNVLLVHYGDLQSGIDEEMRRVARFLEIDVEAPVWPALVESATFAEMRRHGAYLLPGVDSELNSGVDSFLSFGRGSRWQGMLTPESIENYRIVLEENCSPNLARWLESGRSKTGDPALQAD